MSGTEFDAERSRLTAIAARILGSETEAEDVVQEAWLRFSRAEGIGDVAAWLTTVTTRLCLDHLRKRRTRTDAEGLVAADASMVDPEADVLLADQVGGAMQVVFDTLTPAERAAFVLHDVFGYRFEEITSVLGRSDTAVRQLASRARRKVQAAPEPVAESVTRSETSRVVDAFLAAARGGDLATLLSLLAPEAVMRPDLACQRMGTEERYEGAAAVAERFDGAKGAAPVDIDGDLGAAWIMAGEVKVAFIFHVESGLVREIEQIADPDVLSTLDITGRR